MHFLCQIANIASRDKIRIDTWIRLYKDTPFHFYTVVVAVFTSSRISYSHKLRQAKEKRSGLELNTMTLHPLP